MAHRPSLKRVPTDAEKLKNAINLVKDGIISLYGAAKLTGVPRNILCRHFQRYINEEKGAKLRENKLHQRVSIEVFTEDEEHQLLNNIKDYASSHKVFSLKTVQELAYRFAKQKDKKYPASWDEHKMAGVSWLQRFRKRYNDHILLRNPEAYTRIVNPPKVIPPSTTPPPTLPPPTPPTPPPITPPPTTFLNFKAALDKCPSDLSPSNIWNIDEITLHNPPEILTTGETQSSSVSNSDDSNNLTIISAINAGGDTVPPMMIFPNVDYKDFVLDGAPPGTIGAINSSGGPNEDLFLEFFIHFLRYAKPSKDLPCIVLLDNHTSHMCLPVQQVAKERGVILIIFKPHHDHKVQPIDEGVSEIFKSFYNSAAKELLLTANYAGRKIYTCDIAALVGKAFPMAFTRANIIQGFRITGFYPFNENRHQDFSLHSNVTDRFAAIDRDSSASPQTDDSHSCSSQRSSLESTSSSSIVRKIIRCRQDDPRKSTYQVRSKSKSRILAETLGKTIIEKINNHKLMKNKKAVLDVKSKFEHKHIPFVTRKVYTISDSSDDSINFLSDSEI